MTTDQRRENSQLQDIHGEENGRELIWYTCQEIQGTVDHHRAEAKSCERHYVNMCGTTQHAEKPSEGADRPPTPVDNIQGPQADQGEQGCNRNFPANISNVYKRL